MGWGIVYPPYSVINMGAAEGAQIPSFDYDAVVMLGDSLTAGTFQTRELEFQSYAESVGFPSTTKFYGTGLSGHTTKTFTEAWVQGVGVSPNRTLADYESLLSGKKVLFVSLLGANDIRDLNKTGTQEDYENSLAAKKVEVDLWGTTLRDAIIGSSLNASYAIASFPYVDWRPGATMISDDVYDIIDGLSPFYDQRDWSARVVNPLAEKLTPDFVRNGKPLIDFYGIIRNAFRFSIDLSEGVHPSPTTRDYIIRKFTDVLYKWYTTNTIDDIELFDYHDTVMNVGESAVLSADIDYNAGLSPLDYSDSNILALTASQGVFGSCLKDSVSGRLFGKAYAYTDMTAFSGGTSNTGDASSTLDNEKLTATNLRATTVKNIWFDNLPPNATFTVSICSSRNAIADIKVTDFANPANTIEIADTRAVSAGDHKKGSMTGVQSDSNGKIRLTVEPITAGKTWYLAGVEITRTA